ncbi:acetyltransferase [Pediococcus argentinicus]|uniref:Acetyltransferase n=2 Tax=Pediococcus argentinicus TaxID=480391 RepID=A0A0R2NJ18_9LACO|nr:acetyltransferase [Pediococcus argentinicus]
MLEVDHMLDRLTNWIKQNLLNRTRRLREEAFEIKHHIVEIEGESYFVAQAMFPDIPEILGVERAVYDGLTPWDRTAFANELRRKSDRLYLVIRKNDQLIGFIGASFDDRLKQAHITNVAVLPDFQNRGLGAFLIEAIIKKAQFIEYRTLTLEVRRSNHNAQALYLKIGFEKVGVKERYYFGDHEDAIDMSLDLSKWRGGYHGNK